MKYGESTFDIIYLLFAIIVVIRNVPFVALGCIIVVLYYKKEMSSRSSGTSGFSLRCPSCFTFPWQWLQGLFPCSACSCSRKPYATCS